MLGVRQIAELIPHQGSMCLLREVVGWDAAGIVCRADSHLHPGNPLRRDGRLSSVCGIEYGLQAAALHGALRCGTAQPPGYLAGLRDVALEVAWLDDAALGTLDVTATLELSDPAGSIYAFCLAGADGRMLVAGRATIVVPVEAAR